VLRQYQGLIRAHEINTPRCAVFAGMGLGKTASTASAISTLSLVDDIFPALIIAPLRVAQSTWPEEMRKWRQLSHLSVMPIIGSEAERRAALRMNSDIYSINYENLPWLQEFYGDRWPFKTVVADESTKLKSFRLRQGGARAAALGKVAHSKVKRFIALTGTPAPNGLLDLWGQMWFVDAGQRLGRTMEAYKQRWFRAHPSGYGLEPLPHAQAEIEDKLRDVCLTVNAADWFDLKEPIVTPVYVDLPPKVQKLYKDMEKDLFMQFDDVEIEAFNAAAKSQKLLQIASGAVYLDPDADSDDHKKAKEWREVHTAKLQALESILDEANGMPVLLAYHFKSDLARLLKAFPQARVLDKNPQTIKDWNAGKIPLLLAHPASAGHGLNMQDGGNILVYFSHDWNLENRAQILERIGPTRQLQSGYNRNVFVYEIIARGTMDEIVIERVKTKASIQDLFLKAMRRVLT
jgi:SNF2 family DNA or RNA helicase